MALEKSAAQVRRKWSKDCRDMAIASGLWPTFLHEINDNNDIIYI